MKHSIQLFVIISLCTATSTSIAMELETTAHKNNKLKKIKFPMPIEMEVELCKEATIISEITCIKNPTNACYLKKDAILVKGDKQYNIVNPTTNQIIQNIFDDVYDKHYQPSIMAVDPNKTKFVIAAYHLPPDSTSAGDLTQKVTIYNAHTYQIEHTIDCDTVDYSDITSICLSQLDDTFAACVYGGTDVILYNYTTNTTNTIEVQEARSEFNLCQPRSPVFSLHPIQPLVCLAWNTVYIHDLKISQSKPINYQSHYSYNSNYLDYYENSYHRFCEYSPDGSFIVKGTYNKVSVIKLNNGPNITTLCKPNENQFDLCTMAIHPNSKILILLCCRLSQNHIKHRILEYWDINKSQCITRKKVPSQIQGLKWHISVSPCGSKLIIATDSSYFTESSHIVEGSCFEFKIPFKLFYKKIKKNTLLYLLFALKNYVHDGTVIPDEIIQLIMKTALETYKRY